MIFTLVQHSGFVVGGDSTFRNAVEERAITTRVERQRIERVGGLILGSYREADEVAMRINYPPGSDGLVPNVRGSFSALKLDGLSLYIPAEADKSLV